MALRDQWGKARGFIGPSGGVGQPLLYHLAEELDQRRQIGGEPRKSRFSPVITLIHVEPAVDLDLQGMPPARRRSVMAGRETSGIRRIKRDGELTLGEEGSRRLDDMVSD